MSLKGPKGKIKPKNGIWVPNQNQNRSSGGVQTNPKLKMMISNSEI
jgi:hypothetical protein